MIIFECAPTPPQPCLRLTLSCPEVDREVTAKVQALLGRQPHREVGDGRFSCFLFLSYSEGSHSQQLLSTEWGRCGVWRPGLRPGFILCLFLSLICLICKSGRLARGVDNHIYPAGVR